MKRVLIWLMKLIGMCLGLGFIVGTVEKKCGKVGWVKSHKPFSFYENTIKRPLEFGLSLFALIALSPVIAITAVLVRLKLGKPVLFRQERPGLGGRIFTIRKFRTMVDGEGSDEERLTDFGRKLRSMSIDELPELVNILEGSMSVIGPRPLLVEYLPRYNKEQKHRHDVRPGLTSLSASKDRNLASWEKKFADDVEYANHISFMGDCKIILDTVKIVLKREGIHSKTSETMEYFRGNDN